MMCICTHVSLCRRGYEDNHIDEMIALCHRHRVERVSFAVHSLLAQQSGHEAVPRLLEHVPGAWHCVSDHGHVVLNNNRSLSPALRTP